MASILFRDISSLCYQRMGRRELGHWNMINLSHKSQQCETSCCFFWKRKKKAVSNVINRQVYIFPLWDIHYHNLTQNGFKCLQSKANELIVFIDRWIKWKWWWPHYWRSAEVSSILSEDELPMHCNCWHQNRAWNELFIKESTGFGCQIVMFGVIFFNMVLSSCTKAYPIVDF